MPPTKDPYRYFRVEARDLLDQLGRGVIALEQNPGDTQGVARLLRLAHTLKGAARVVKQSGIADAAHAVEDVLAPLRETTQALPRAQIDPVLAQLDRIGACLAALPGSADTAPVVPATAQAATQAAAGPERHAPTDLDALLEGLAQAHAQVATLRQGLAGLPQGGQPGSGGALQRRLADTVDRLDRELRQVRDTAESMRLVPAALLFMPLERTARDAAQALGKQAVFDGAGGAVRLDADVLGLLQAALVQLVRNAVAHGIESPAQRLAAGKSAAGCIRLEVVQQGRHARLTLSDDGAGVDLDAVRSAAQRRGWLDPSTEVQGAQALLQLLLRGGLSTASRVTEVAGRGIGLDLVRDTAQRLGAEVAVQTAAGHGTTVQLTVPLAISALQALEVQAGGMTVAIPLEAVRCTLRFDARLMARGPQGDTWVHDGQPLPFMPLVHALQGPRPGENTARFGSAVIVQSASGLAAIAVDRLLGIAAVVMRPLPDLAPADALVAGASLAAHGQPQLVLAADALVRLAQQAGTRPVPAPPPQAPLLVVDDSLTTRMLEQSILESAGYTVHAAVSAEDALERARHQHYALFLVDVEMPGMDGFTFVERTRADPQLRSVPALLISSRASPEDRRRGLTAGAQGYIVKSEFAQADFLRRVHELVNADDPALAGVVP